MLCYFSIAVLKYEQKQLSKMFIAHGSREIKSIGKAIWQPKQKAGWSHFHPHTGRRKRERKAERNREGEKQEVAINCLPQGCALFSRAAPPMGSTASPQSATTWGPHHGSVLRGTHK